MVLYRTEHFAEALKKTDQGLATTGPDFEIYWRFRILRASVLLGRRETTQAQAALKFDLPRIGSSAGNRARYLLCQGFVAALRRDNTSATRFLADAVPLAQASGDGDLLAEIKNRQGYLAVLYGHPEEASALFHQALDYAKAAKVPWLVVAATGNVGFQLVSASQFDEAMPWFAEARALAHKLGAVESGARNLGNLGWCNYRIGEVDRALQQSGQALAIFERTGNRFEQQIWLGNIGSIHLLREEYVTAGEYYRRALEISRALDEKAFSAMWLTNLSQNAINMGDPDTAERYNKEGIVLKTELGLRSAATFNALNSARIAFARKEFDRAESFSRGALAASLDDPLSRLQARNELALVFVAKGENAKAEAEFRNCIREAEGQRSEFHSSDQRRAYISVVIGFYENYTRFLMEQGREREALEVADSSHAMTLRERLRLARPNDGGSLHAADFQRLAASSGTTFLSYSLGDAKSWLWVITPRRIQAFTLPPAAELQRSLTAWDATIQGRRDPIASPNEAGKTLFDVLVAPALPLLKEGGRVTIIPDGFLYSLNFETLPVPGTLPEGKPHYWIEDVEVSVAPALGMLHSGSQRAVKRPDSLLLIGAAVSPVPEFPDLKFAPREMESVRRNTAGIHTTMLEGAAARPEAWLASKPGGFSLIHFAAHASANSDEPFESAVILSRDAGAGSNFRLRAKDIVATPVQARLVTLSACRSAGSRIYSGEGLVGIASAFLEAGAHNVIAGLWDVSDESGSQMMARLYSGMAKGETPAAALRNSKLELLHEGGLFRKPWYWAPFQIFTTDAGT
jgi:CHAT domain-containing protein/Tfp pilus assembly protein PilF